MVRVVVPELAGEDADTASTLEAAEAFATLDGIAIAASPDAPEADALAITAEVADSAALTGQIVVATTTVTTSVIVDPAEIVVRVEAA